MKKFKNIMTAICVITVIVSCLTMTIIRPKGKNSFQENRPLAELPKLSINGLSDGSCTRNLSAYMTDHFAGRSYWLSAKSKIDLNIGESIVNNVYIGDTMQLSLESNTDRNFDKTIELINSFNDNYSGTLYLAAVPSSSGIYTDKLPKYFTENTEKKQIDDFYNGLNGEIRKIDAYNILKMLNDNYIYYRNDSRWTSYGAYCVYRTVIQKLGFLPIAYDKYTIEHITGNFMGNLYNRSQYKDLKADIIDIYNYSSGTEVISCTGIDNNGNEQQRKLYYREYIGTNNMYKMYLGEDVPLIRINTNVNNEKRLLLIKDDYANCFVPFLTQHYSVIDIVSPECIEKGLSDFADINDYEQILFLFGIDSYGESEIFKHINE